MAKPRLTKKQKAVLSRMERGDRLRVQIHEPPFFFDGDNPVNARTVKSLERIGKIRLDKDGLFGGDGQTYVLA